MPSVTSLLRAAWTFARKQPALVPVGFWFLLIPMFGLAVIDRFRETIVEGSETPAEAFVLLLLIASILVLASLWGSLCTLIVARRMLQSKAGRARTSLKAVRAQARGLFLPLLLTVFLRGILTILWGLLLVLPGIVYAIRTVFAPVVVAGEGIAYRPALRQSSAVVRGRFWRVLGTLVLLSIALFLPVSLLGLAVDAWLPALPLPALLTVDLLLSAISALTTILWLLALTHLYAQLRPVSGKGYVHTRT